MTASFHIFSSSFPIIELLDAVHKPYLSYTLLRLNENKYINACHTNIRSSHGDTYEEFCLVGCGAM
jgi:hypothetical protein